jgi:hypothetical protein
MDELEQKYAGKAQKRFQKLQRKLSRKLERLEGSLEIRPSLKRISSSPKLMVLAVAACLVAIPAGSLAFSFAAGVLQVALIKIVLFLLLCSCSAFVLRIQFDLFR